MVFQVHENKPNQEAEVIKRKLKEGGAAVELK